MNRTDSDQVLVLYSVLFFNVIQYLKTYNTDPFKAGFQLVD